MTHYAPRWSPIPTVVAIMDLGFIKSPEQFTTKDLNQLKSWTRYSVLQASKVIAISQHTKKDLIWAYNLNPEKIAVTYLGYDLSLFKPTRKPSVLKKYGISEPYFLFLGSLRPSKNIEGLIHAFVLGNFTQNLVISGKKGWMYDHIFSLVSTLKISNRVVFTGYVDEDEVPVLMTHADGFAMPSFYEGFGIPVLEAMACGTPVVISNVSSLPEVAGSAGIYVDPLKPASIQSGLLKAIGSERQSYIKSGLAQVKKFSWETCARQTLSVLESAV
jgi:glycosyltransferase involved in cell wall biosynthesis